MQTSKVFWKYLTRLILLYVAVGVIGALVFTYLLPQYYFKLFPWVLLYFFLVNLFSILILIKSSNKPLSAFYRTYSLVSAVKFFVSLIGVVLYIIFFKDTLYGFLVTFIILYFHSLFQLVRIFKTSLLKNNSQ